MLALVIFLSHVHAQEIPKEKSAFEQALEHNAGYQTEERWVTVRGVRYREIVFDGKTHYLRFLSPQLNSAEMECDLTNSDFSTRHVEGGVKVFRRTKFFIDLLATSCENVRGHKRVVLKLDPRIGFTLPEDEKSYIKNKKVFISPFTGIGFSGEIP